VTDDQLRALVRDAIARRGRLETRGASAPETWNRHASHGLLPLTRGREEEGACLIEPGVRCNHCGYCLSYGH
jgi:hypothetical protein